MYGGNEPLARHAAGRLDVDINLDGVAHDGLLRHFVQDPRTGGPRRREFVPLFRSAEDYVRTWERCE
jgi:hypothetical protein